MNDIYDTRHCHPTFRTTLPLSLNQGIQNRHRRRRQQDCDPPRSRRPRCLQLLLTRRPLCRTRLKTYNISTNSSTPSNNVTDPLNRMGPRVPRSLRGGSRRPAIWARGFGVMGEMGCGNVRARVNV
ncbi:hypothetical protein PILCRDRAFT_744873 [Piloderma croceum F 1598]|uniref:Uncharacterized protein n=1 Tax=Piloderma croceum (strain F 1598) TaxID=765440 RepID=A0A0C3EWS2_PILCF|nr:hypothetical protein PILCRDRAFT_744873 [Piloderma croceum F 1598]